ncbi:MAG: PH domain-containing protein [Parcubacteria group bacterium]|nr:PH domain-containing protein [Parcubacteria group bacterium]
MQQLDPKAVLMFFIQNLLIFGLPIIIIIFSFLGDEGAVLLEELEISPVLWWGGLLSLGVLVIILLWVIAKLTYHFVRYELREEGFRKEHGIIWKTYVTIPYNRIQNVDIHRGIIARLLGLSDLEIQTAGASAVVRRRGVWGVGAEGTLPGLSREVAEKLRDELVHRARKGAGQGL